MQKQKRRSTIEPPLIDRLIDYINSHGTDARKTGDAIGAFDEWTYRDDNNVKVAGEWRTLEGSIPAVREFLGY